MHIQVSSILSIATAVVAVTAFHPNLKHAPWDPVLSPRAKLEQKNSSTRPILQYHPKAPYISPSPLARTKTCYVKSSNGADDSPAILSALQECNDGGHVIFSKGVKYLIGTAMDWTFLKHIDIDIQGEILFSDDTKYWQANSFKFGYQNITSFFKLGGEDVFIYGGGTLNGNGQVWYDLYATDITVLRPALVAIDGLKNSILADLNLRYSPQFYNFVANSSNVIYDNISIDGASTSKNEAKNTDGWDTYRSDNIVIQNSVVSNGDDCVSFKPNSTNILVQNIQCNGSHGISVGSLGQSQKEFDIAENIYVYNATMQDCTAGARIKVWMGSHSVLKGDLQGGGGDGRIRNVTYDTMHVKNVNYAIQVNQCYGGDKKDMTSCTANPSSVTITDVVFKNFTGTTSKKYDPLVGSFACSNTKNCNNIVASGIDVVSATGMKQAFCLNVDPKVLDLTCVAKFKGSG